MKNIIFSFVLLFVLNNSVSADCITGFACSINDLEKQEYKKLMQNIEIYKKYIERNKKDIVLTIRPNSFNYNDLFIFSSFV